MRNRNATNSKYERLIIGVIYRHPGPHFKNFSDALEKNLSQLGQQKCKTVIVGDANIDLSKFNLTSKVTEYVHLVTAQGFNFFIDKPTRITSHSATCIDHVYSNLPVENLESIIIESDVSDHFGTLTNIYNLIPISDKADVYYRKSNLTSDQWKSFNSELQYTLACNLPSTPIDFDINEYANTITSTNKSLIDK